MSRLTKLLGSLGISNESKLQTEEHEKTREATIQILEEIHYLGRIHKENHLDGLTEERLGIKCQELDLKTDGSFLHSDYFRPWSLLLLERHPIDLDDKVTREWITGDEMIWTNEHLLRGKGLEATLNRIICCHFMYYHRKGPGNTKLQILANWEGRHMKPGMLNNEFWDPICEIDMTSGKYLTCIENAWHPPGNLPHLLFTMEHAIGADERLMRNEILFIIGVMITRLESPLLKINTIIPVMAISSFDDKKARLIQAHFDSGQLVIRKSKLHDFSTLEGLDRNVNLFMLYMASECVGNTKVVGDWMKR